jgi:chromosome segregation ATPase
VPSNLAPSRAGGASDWPRVQRHLTQLTLRNEQLEAELKRERQERAAEADTLGELLVRLAQAEQKASQLKGAEETLAKVSTLERELRARDEQLEKLQQEMASQGNEGDRASIERIAQIAADNGRALARLEEEHSKAMNVLRSSHDDALSTSATQHERDMNELKAKMEETKTRLSEELAKLRAENESSLIRQNLLIEECNRWRKASEEHRQGAQELRSALENAEKLSAAASEALQVLRESLANAKAVTGGEIGGDPPSGRTFPGTLPSMVPPVIDQEPSAAAPRPATDPYPGLLESAKAEPISEILGEIEIPVVQSQPS